MGESVEDATRHFAEAVRIMARLRAPGGCPWDREQNFDSIKKYTLEETYEVFDAIERRDWPGLKDELGDLLLQVLFYAQMAAEAGDFTIGEVVENLNAKLVRRHPHVFGEVATATSGEVLRNWDQIKKQEKVDAEAVRESLLDDIPRTMPAMLEAEKLGSRAAKVGFDWPKEAQAAGLFAKLAEEIAELRAEVALRAEGAANEQELEAEFGDLMFTAANLARHLGLDAETALRGSNAKFRRRFRAMEEANAEPAGLGALSPEQLEALWEQAKQRERK
jgi:XTP/dITP diphosphohydrolase/ATP diphosphatase